MISLGEVLEELPVAQLWLADILGLTNYELCGKGGRAVGVTVP